MVERTGILPPLALLVALAFALGSCSVGGKLARDKQEVRVDTLNVENLLIEAKKQQLLGNYQDASDLYDKVIAQSPDDPVPHYELARMHRGFNRFDQGLRHIRRACDLDPGNKWYWLLQAELQGELMRYDEAADCYARVIGLDDSDPDFYLHLAAAQVKDGQYKKAIGTYNTVEQRFGLNEDVSFQKYRLYLLLKDVDGAVAELQALIDSSPYEIRYYGALADLYTDLRRYPEALEMYHRMELIDPENPYVELALSEYHDITGNADSSSYYLFHAFRSPRLDIDSKMKVLLDYYGQGDKVSLEAYRLLDTLLSLHPTEAKAWSIYGDFLVRDARHEEARDAFRKVTMLDSLRYPVWEQLLLLDSKLDDPEAMVSDGSSAIRLFPEQALPYLLKGAGQVRLGDYGDAIKTLDRGLFFTANEAMEAQFLTYLAEAHYRSGNPARAFATYDRLLVIDPDNPVILNNYSYQLAEKNMDLEKADRMSARAIELDPGNSSNLDTRAWVLFRLKDYEGALVQIDKALTAGGEGNATILEHYGDILYHLGRAGEAETWWRKARDVGKGSPKLDRKISEGVYVE